MLLIAWLLLLPLFAPSEIAFRIPERDLIPEGIAYDAKTRTFFIGSTFKRKIIAIDAGGKVRDFTPEARDGVYGILGMRVDPVRRVLWAISSSAGASMPARGLGTSCAGCSTVTSYDLASGKLREKYELSNKESDHFLNDLVVTKDGSVFITDTGSGDIYRITRDKKALERFARLGPGTAPNGIDLAPDGRTLFVASLLGVSTVDVASGRATLLKGLPGDTPPTIDGLYYFNGSLIAVQPFQRERRIVRYVLSPSGDIAKTEVIEGEHPLFRQPTTGVIVGTTFYYIANAQLQFFRAMYKDGSYDRNALQDVLILKTSLK